MLTPALALLLCPSPGRPSYPLAHHAPSLASPFLGPCCRPPHGEAHSRASGAVTCLEYSLAPPLACCVSVGKGLPLSVPQAPLAE